MPSAVWWPRLRAVALAAARSGRGAHAAAHQTAAHQTVALRSARPPARLLGAAEAEARRRSIDLTARIKGLPTPEAVAQMHARDGHLFDDINLSAAWYQVHRTTVAWSLERKRGLLGLSRAPEVDEADASPAWPQPQPPPADGAVALLAAHVERRLPHFEPRALAHAAYVAAKLDAQPLLVASAEPLERLVDRCSPRLLANALWAFASRGVRAPGLFSRARDHLVTTDALERFNTHDLSNVAWSFAMVGEASADATLFRALAHAASLTVDDLEPSHVAMIAGALAIAGAREPALFAQLVRRAHAQIDVLEPLSISKLLWAVARSGAGADDVPPGAAEDVARLFDAVLMLPHHRLEALPSRGLCQLIWAFNAARYLHRTPSTQLPPSRAAVGAAGRAEARAADVSGVGGAGGGGSGVASHSQLSRDERDGALIRLLDLSMRRLPTLSPAEQVLVGWAFAPSHLPRVPALLQHVSAAVEPELHELSPQALSMLGWAHAAAFVPSAPLLARLAAVAARRFDELRPQGIVTLLWAALLVGASAEPLLARLARMSPEQLDGFIAPQLTLLGWALCVNGAFPPELLRALLGRINALPPSTYSAHSQMQLHQLNTALALDAPNLGVRVAPELLPTPSPRAEGPSSATHYALSRALSSLYVPHVNEQLLGGLGYRVDVVLTASRHVLQVNGPMHYLPSSREPAPKMLFMRRHIEKAGWTVIDVPYWEMDAHLTVDDVSGGPTSDSMCRYLRALLARHGAACGRPSG
ncbi:hypothetical protein KFE25_009872 [Diacronema lutheri]|uniref:RAP domain-containing protein n=1 Tax=Diacronema lutheri TaxID=2081491 RepID=A0A8J5XIX4_DIALT|nr:hypothetical protein KFE25_009872 [Diacronema lutheri]